LKSILIHKRLAHISLEHRLTLIKLLPCFTITMVLIQKDYVKAYAYFRAALLQAPNMSPVLANLGYLYRLTGHYEFAENTYLQAIKKDKTI
jgi:tetratricopeptide (TPR) repeat protein